MSEKPRDILEFLRRAGSEPSAGVPRSAVVDPLPRVSVQEKSASEADFSKWMLVRRSQVVVAGIAAALFAILTFVLGLAWGDGGSDEEQGGSGVGGIRVWTIRAIEYDASANGEVRAKAIAAQLGRVADDEVTVQRLDRDRKLAVNVGSWLKNPNENEQALTLLKKVRERKVHGSDRRPFADAYFLRITR